MRPYVELHCSVKQRNDTWHRRWITLECDRLVFGEFVLCEKSAKKNEKNKSKNLDWKALCNFDESVDELLRRIHLIELVEPFDCTCIVLSNRMEMFSKRCNDQWCKQIEAVE
jgi:hypothetical protein